MILFSKVVPHLLLASCWLRCVLLAQFAISVSASLRIRSDFVLDEWALESEKGSKISDGSSTNGRCRGIGSFRDYPHSWYDQRTIRDILPLYPLQKPCFVGKPSLELAESNPPSGVCKLLKDCVQIAIFNIQPLHGKLISSIVCKELGEDQYHDMRRLLPLIVIEIGLCPLFVCVRHPEAFGTGSLPALETWFSTPGPCFSTQHLRL